MKTKALGAITLALVSSTAWSQVNVTNNSSNSQVVEIGNANTGEVVIDNGNGQQIVKSKNPVNKSATLDTNLKPGTSASVDAAGNTNLRSGTVSAEVSQSGNVELNTGTVNASTTSSSGETNLSTGDVDANMGSDGSLGLSVGDINLKVK